jgi:hypothetical protein
LKYKLQEIAEEGIKKEIPTQASILDLISSSNTQLEFFTLIGIIFNALMQGYVCINSIYVFLIQNLEEEPSGVSHQDEQTIRNDSFDFEISSTPKSENIMEKL